MTRARDLYEQVREAQKLLGTGEVEEAVRRAEPLREQASRLLARGGHLTSFDRTYAGAALTYATVVLILGAADTRPPAESVPMIRGLATELAQAPRRPEIEAFKALAAAAEMLARAGDAEGAVWAVRKADQLAENETYVTQLVGSIRSMYPQVFAEAPDPPPDQPPPLAARRP